MFGQTLLSWRDPANVSSFQKEESDFVGQKLEDPEIHHFMVCGSREDQLLYEFLDTVNV